MRFDGTQVQEYVTRLRRIFHCRPELGLQERETSRRIREELERLDIPYQRIGETAVIAELQGTGDRAVALRADMDALPIQEKTGLPYASACPGIMHACGHDAHTAMLLGAAKLLAARRDTLPGRVRFIFEPAEEFGGAGAGLLRAGALSGIDSVFALHVMPQLAAGKVSVEPGVRMAGIGVLHCIIHGKSGHAAMPHQGVDAVLAACTGVVNLQSLISRELPANDAVVISITHFQGGGLAGNVLPDTAEFSGCIRYFEKGLEQPITAGLERILAKTAETFRATAQTSISYLSGPCVSDTACSAIAVAAARKALGPEGLAPLPPVSTSDDFALYLEHVPGVYAFLGVGNECIGATDPLHSPGFILDESVLGLGSAMHAQYAWEYLTREGAPLSTGEQL